MEQWKEYKLGDIATMKYGKLPPKTTEGKFPIWSGYRYVGYTDKHNCCKGTIIVVARGVGGTGDVKIAEQDCFLTNLSIAVELDALICLPLYFYYQYHLTNLRYLDTGSVQSQITVDDLKKLHVKLPSLSTQRRIAAVLSTLDAKIELNRRINDNLEQQAQALFRSWFVDFEPFGGVMPKEWKMGKLKDIADIQMGQSPIGSSLNQDGNGMIFYQGRTEFSERFVSIKSYTTAPTRLAKSNSILLSVRAPVGDVNITLNDCCIGRGIAALNPIKGNNTSFLYQILKYKRDDFDLYNGEGTVFGCINRNALMDFDVIIPDSTNIEKFGYIMKPIDNELEIRYREISRLASLRDTLLPRLMSGELKVNEINA